MNAVAPGVIKTPMHTPETHSFLAGLHPLRRMGEVREVVEAVLYLESATFVTGEKFARGWGLSRRSLVTLEQLAPVFQLADDCRFSTFASLLRRINCA